MVKRNLQTPRSLISALNPNYGSFSGKVYDGAFVASEKQRMCNIRV
jgi:hypothetical protein